MAEKEVVKRRTLIIEKSKKRGTTIQNQADDKALILLEEGIKSIFSNLGSVVQDSEEGKSIHEAIG